MILMNDFKAEPKALREAMLQAVSEVFDSGWYVLGPKVQAFETAWAQACGVGHAVGVANGMDAIEIVLRAAGIGPGDEVVTTPMTAFATVLAIVRAGATPVLADIDPQSGLLDPVSVERCLGDRTRAVVLVHLYGQVRQMAVWQELAARRGLLLVEDCAQSHLARWNGQVAGSFGVAGAYSFYPTKNLGAIGDGGALVTNDATLAAKAAQLRNYGQSERYHHPLLGMNSRLDEIHAAMLLVRLEHLQADTLRRRAIARRYRTEIVNPHLSHLAAPEQDEAHVHHLFVLTSPHRDALQQHMSAHGVQTLIHYPVPVHHQVPMKDVRKDPAGLSATLAHARSCLSLPCHPYLDDAQVGVVIQAANSFSA